MLGLLIAGILCGMTVTTPIGPMAMMTALRWAEHHHKEATRLAFGVAVGDFILAVIALLIFMIPDDVPRVPHLWLGLGAAILLWIMAAYTWWQADRPVKPMKAHHSFWAAVALTMTHPGNTAAVFALFASLVPTVSGYLVSDLTPFLCFILLAGVAGGLAFGWFIFLSIVAAAVQRYGKLPPHLRMWCGRIISVLMTMAAVMVLLEVL